jgi:hypothetical protein
MAKFKLEDCGHVRYHCPGCKHDHTVPAGRWHWNNDIDKPSLSPSVRHYYTLDSGKEVTTCHYHIKNGNIAYCGDCEHELKGQTIPLPDIE